MSDFLDKKTRDSIKAILLEEGDSLIAELRANMVSEDANATGKTSRSLSVRARVLKAGLIDFEIVGGEGWQYVEQGRGASKRAGNGEGKKLIDLIKTWMRARGIGAGEKKSVFNGIAFVITRSIHQNGTLLHRLGERRDIYTSVLTEKRIESIANRIANKQITEITTDLFDLR